MHAGILGVIERADGLSQQALGERLGVFPSRLVGVLDDLEGRGLVERRNSPTDRRSYALYLTEGGRKALEQIASRRARAPGRALRRPRRLGAGAARGAPARIAAQQGLTPGVHPGFRKLGGGEGT